MNKTNRKPFNSIDFYNDHDDESLIFNDPYCILMSKKINEKKRKNKTIKTRVKVS